MIGRRRDPVEPLSVAALDQLAMLRDPQHFRYSGITVRCGTCPEGRDGAPGVRARCCRDEQAPARRSRWLRLRRRKEWLA